MDHRSLGSALRASLGMTFVEKEKDSMDGSESVAGSAGLLEVCDAPPSQGVVRR